MAKGDSAPKAALKAGVETVKDSGLKGASTIKDKVSEAVGGDNDGDKGKDKMKFINIVEELDLPVPRAVAYQAWTQFEEFPSFMKKVENVEQQEDQTVEWKAQIFWSHRSWTAEIVDQVPNQRIVWRSKGEKGHVDGAVTFHELTPDLTRMLVNLEYYPQGLFERTGNLWRAQGRRARLELKFFRRYITSEVLLRQDEVEGWAGEIHDGEVTEEASDSKDQGSERRRWPRKPPTRRIKVLSVPNPLQQPRALRRNRPPPQQHRAGLAQLRRSRHPASHRLAGLAQLRRSRPPTSHRLAGLAQPRRSRLPRSHRPAGLAQPRRSRPVPHRQAAEPQLRNRRPRPREAGRDDLWQRLKYRTRRRRTGFAAECTGFGSGGLGSVSLKARWSAFDAHLRMLCSSSIGASAICTALEKRE